MARPGGNTSFWVLLFATIMFATLMNQSNACWTTWCSGGWRCTPRTWTLADRKSYCPPVPVVTSSSKCPSGTNSVEVVVGRFKDNTKINAKRNFGKIKGKLCGRTGYATGRNGEAYDSFVLDDPHQDKYDAGAGVTEDSELRKMR